jgi:hypothetical protein
MRTQPPNIATKDILQQAAEFTEKNPKIAEALHVFDVANQHYIKAVDSLTPKPHIYHSRSTRPFTTE